MIGNGQVYQQTQDSILNTVTDGEPEPPKFIPTVENDDDDDK